MWQEQLNLPQGLFNEDWPSPETPDFWEVAYYDQEVEAILADQVPKFFKKSLEVKKALATCYIWINSIAEVIDDAKIQETLKNSSLLSANAISLIFNGPMTDYILEQVDIYPPSRSEPFNTYLEKQPKIKTTLKKLSPEMRGLAWWSFWATFDSEYQRSISGLETTNLKKFTKKEAVSFMQNKLGLKPPKIIGKKL